MADRGGDKGTAHSYIPVYEREMTKRDSIALCEIGVYEGHSLAMWQEYFTNSTIIGLDINTDNVRFEVQAINADATRLTQVNKALGEQTFDYIIDDGSHKLQDQLRSLEIFWPKLKTGGKYFVEDIKGDPELGALKQWFASKGVVYKIHDGRKTINRNDDLLLIAERLQ